MTINLKCVRNSYHEHVLTKDKVYPVIWDPLAKEYDMVRVQNDLGIDMLFFVEMFVRD